MFMNSLAYYGITKVPTNSPTLAIFSSFKNCPNSRAIRTGAPGSQNVAVPTSTAVAPAIRNSAEQMV